MREGKLRKERGEAEGKAKYTSLPTGLQDFVWLFGG